MKRELLLTTSLATLLSVAQGAQQPKKNILVIMTDDQTYNSIHALGNNDVITPNFDKMVEQGVTFTHHYATTSISMASRACLMTGMYEYKSGCNFMRGGLTTAQFESSYPVLLREDGYYTGFGGKFGFPVVDEDVDDIQTTNKYLPKESFDSFAGQGHHIFFPTKMSENIRQYADEYPHLTRALGAYGVDVIDEAQRQQKPFCLSLYFKAPHGPIVLDPMFTDIYKDTVFSKPENYGREFQKDLAPQSMLGRQHLQHYGQLDTDYQQECYKLNTLIYGVDYVLGQLFDALKERGLDQNTVVIFTSDNGTALGEHALYGKVLPYESTSRVPLIVWDPSNSQNGGKFTAALAGNVDITATILDYAGVKAPSNMDGRTLRKVVENPDTGEAREYLPLINTWGNPQIHSLSVVSKEHKYIYWSFAEGMGASEELYDCTNDPLELKNLMKDSQYAEVVKQMQKAYDKQLKVWKKECVQRYEYPNYVTIFDRNVPWSEKRQLIDEQSWEVYDLMLKSFNYTDDKFNYRKVLKAVYQKDSEARVANSQEPERFYMDR
ncbi:MAG: sulfatase-like hydrolase/transferase [Rikenellaceae bacterium]